MCDTSSLVMNAFMGKNALPNKIFDTIVTANTPQRKWSWSPILLHYFFSKNKYFISFTKRKKCEYDILALYKQKYDRHFFIFLYETNTLFYIAEV